MKITIKEALAQGYEHAGRNTGGFQRYSQIKELQENELLEEEWFVVDKEKNHPGIDAESLKDLIVNHIDGDWYDRTHDDDSTIPDALHDLDATAWADEINKSLEVIWSSKLTKIQLVP